MLMSLRGERMIWIPLSTRGPTTLLETSWGIRTTQWPTWCLTLKSGNLIWIDSIVWCLFSSLNTTDAALFSISHFWLTLLTSSDTEDLTNCKCSPLELHSTMDSDLPTTLLTNFSLTSQSSTRLKREDTQNLSNQTVPLEIEAITSEESGVNSFFSIFKHLNNILFFYDLW